LNKTLTFTCAVGHLDGGAVAAASEAVVLSAARETERGLDLGRCAREDLTNRHARRMYDHVYDTQSYLGADESRERQGSLVGDW